MSVLCTGLVACGDDDPVTPAAQTITQTAAATPQLFTLVSALTAAELTGTLNGTGPFTVGGARITTPDVIAKNGVIHVIDTVLLP